MTTQQRNVEIVMTQGKLDDILQAAYDRGYEAGQGAGYDVGYDAGQGNYNED